MSLPRWGIVTTVKAPVEQVLAFVAHHLALGPDRIFVHLDDPETGSIAALEGLPGVRPIACDARYWRQMRGKRPPAHQYRQALNLQRVYARTKLDWLLHIDVDEFLLAEAPVAPMLAAATGPMVRVEPWDALHDPQAPDDIFRGRWFRRALRPGEDAAGLMRLLAPYGTLLKRGILGHSAGKCFFRTGLPDFAPAIHTARQGGVQLDAGAFAPGLALLHFHAEDPATWRARLPFRTEQGAYRNLPELQAFFQTATPETLDDFYRVTQTATPAALAGLAALGMLREERLGLREKVAGLVAACAGEGPVPAPGARDE